MRKKPKLTNIHTVAQSRIFNVESMEVEFQMALLDFMRGLFQEAMGRS